MTNMGPDTQVNERNDGVFFQGIVDCADAATYVHTVAPSDKQLTSLQKIQGVPVSLFFCNLFGIKASLLIQPGTRVLCYKTAPTFCYIICVLPDNDIAPTDYPARANLGAGDANSDSCHYQGYGTEGAKGVLYNTRRPTDVVDGELVLGNDYGVMVSLLTAIATLKASDLAQVQCHLLDDMVRIISHNFEHMTALGQFKVFHDGKTLSAEFEATSAPVEAQGIPETTEIKNGSIFNQTNKASINDNPDFFDYGTNYNETTEAISRFKYFLGTFGDFFNFFLSRPADNTIRDLSGTQPTLFDTGLAHGRLSKDGGAYFRATKEVFIEKTNWIRVPLRIRKPEDPNGDDGTTVTIPQKTAYKYDQSQSYYGNPGMMFLQLRNYVAYVNEVQGYQNINAFAKDLSVNNDVTKETLINRMGQVDPYTPSDQASYQLRTAGLYMMENGGITIRDAFGSAIVMENGNIYLQAANDVMLQPLNNLIAKVGQFVSIAAQNDIDLSSSSKGIRLKSELSQYFYSNSSGIVLESAGTTNTAGTPDPERLVIDNIGGIVCKSALGIYNFADTNIVNIATQSLIAQTQQDIRLNAKNVAQLSSDSTAILSGLNAAYLLSPSNVSVLSQNACTIGGLNQTVIGQKGTEIDIGYAQNNPWVDTLYGATDLTNIYLNAAKNVLQDSALQQQAAPFTSNEQILGVQFNFLSTDAYSLDESDFIPMTIAQQEDVLSGLYGLTTWVETSINGSYPYPGADNFDSGYLITSGPIPNLQVYEGKDYTGKPTATADEFGLSTESLNTYKVQS